MVKFIQIQLLYIVSTCDLYASEITMVTAVVPSSKQCQKAFRILNQSLN